MATRRHSHSEPSFVIYSRKSTEAEDRQVLSIDSQIEELDRLAQARGVPLGEILREARSAKAPGRPIFNNMLKRVEAGEVAGVLCWKLDRLARNPVDGGRVIWAVKTHGVRIITPTQTFSRDDANLILMYVEFGMAHQYIDDLGRAVKRGLEAKARLGWWPTLAPLGYLNNPTQPRGARHIVSDPDSFELCRRMWRLMATGAYSPPQVLKIATDDWGLRTRKDGRVSRSAIYRFFTNRFYTGEFEYPRGSGTWRAGHHEPMVSVEDFDRVQAILGSRGRPRPVHQTFAFTGLIRCGQCSAMITAEEKLQVICSVCRLKFASRSRDRCPRCNTTIEKMYDQPRPPTHLRYVYYHCTKQKDRSCPERVVTEAALEQQIAAYLERVAMPADLERQLLPLLRHRVEGRESSEETLRRHIEHARTSCIARLDNLVQLKTSPANVAGVMLSDEEYIRQRTALLTEKSRLGAMAGRPSPDPIERLGLLERVLRATREARDWLTSERPRRKRLALALLSGGDSNLTLQGKRLHIYARNPIRALAASRKPFRVAEPGFEPVTWTIPKTQNTPVGVLYPISWASWDDARTKRRLLVSLKKWVDIVSLEELNDLRQILDHLSDAASPQPSVGVSTGQRAA